jgi:Domain of unknown function (DUF1937)
MTGFYYLASPYRAHRDGMEAAFEAAAKMTARLIDARVEVYSPIVHSHPASRWVESAPPEGDFWLARQIPFLEAATGLIVATMPGWLESSGISFERQFNRAANKPEWYVPEDFNADSLSTRIARRHV